MKFRCSVPDAAAVDGKVIMMMVVMVMMILVVLVVVMAISRELT